MRGVGAGERIFELLERRPIIPPDSGIPVKPARTGVVSFENVSFEYPSRKGVEVLKDFSLNLNVGESVAIVYVSPLDLTVPEECSFFIPGAEAGVGSQVFSPCFLDTMTH